MPISLTLLHIAASVCLLLWGTRMVKLGFTRAFGTSLRKILAASTSNPIKGCLSGAATTMLLQSSTATALLLISFLKKNLITLSAGFAVIIGADIATTLVAQILVFDLSWLAPAFMIVGIIGHMKFEHGGRRRHVCRIFIGLGLMLLSLSLIRTASSPLAESETLPLILAPLHFDPLMAILIAALLTWLLHSSLAAILLFATMAGNGILDLELGLLMVIGANLGGAFIAFIATYNEGTKIRRLTIGNILMRFLTGIAVFAALPYIITYIEQLELDTARDLVLAHTGYNILLALLFLPITGIMANLMTKLLKEPTDQKPAAHVPVYLDDKVLSTPIIALASAARETLRMAEMVQDMLEKTIESFSQNTNTLAKQIRQEDDTVDKLYREIKLYLTQLTRESLDPKESDRYFQILTFATNLEHIGDIIDKSLMDLASKKVKKGEKFSEEGWEEIKNFHGLVVEHMKLAQTIFLSEDHVLAQQLVDNKRIVREAQAESSAQHFERLSSGLPETVATSALHLDIIRDYRRINSYITTVAYAILENAQKYENKRH